MFCNTQFEIDVFVDLYACTLAPSCYKLSEATQWTPLKCNNALKQFMGKKNEVSALFKILQVDTA